MYPVLPHLISECLEILNEKNIPDWPIIDKKLKHKKMIKIVVQINGKKRGILNFKDDINEEDLIEKIKINQELKKYLENKEIIKKFYVQNKIINLILK